MQNINGRILYSTIPEIVDPTHTALVVWDVKKMLIDFISNKDVFMNNINRLIESARKCNSCFLFFHRNTSIKI
jgi:nicotinamidase-related amidase